MYTKVKTKLFLIELSHGKPRPYLMLVWFGAKIPVAIVTNTRYDVEVSVDLLVNGRSDYPDARVGIGHRVKSKLSGQDRNKENVLLTDIMILSAHVCVHVCVCVCT